MTRLNVDQIKRDAKRYGRRNAVDYQTALDAVACEHGFADWMALRDEHRRQVAEDRESQPPRDDKAHLPVWR
jgi:hypothetical protein